MFIDKLIKYCTIRSEEGISERYNRSIYLSFFQLISILVASIAGIVNIITGNLTTCLLSFITAAVLTANHIYYRSSANYKNASLLFTIIFSFYIIVQYYFGMIQGQGILVVSIYSSLIFFVLGRKRGIWLGLVFFVIIAVSLFLPNKFFINAPLIPLNSKILFFLLYAIFFLIGIVYERLREKSRKEFYSIIEEAKNETKTKEDFISKLSHQIRTPLNNLVVVTNLVDTKNMDEKQKDMIDTIQASTNNLVNVVNNITELTSVDIEQSRDFSQNFSLQAAVENTISLYKDADSGNISIDLGIEKSLQNQVFGDPVKIKQILLNLIENIIKNSKGGKKAISINISQKNISKSNIETFFEVSTENLVHIPELYDLKGKKGSDLSKLQKAIKRLDINIAKRIIESMNGEYNIDATPNNFNFSFLINFLRPVEEKTEVLPPIEISTEEKKETPKIYLENANVLLVEDNLINQKIVLLSLKKAVKNVDVANNGKEALDKFGSVKYDIILMDIQMPVMNGIVTTKKIRNIEKSTSSHTPIIAITANALLGDKEECLAAGMDDYISKPFQIETLINKMKVHLSE